MMKDIIKMLGLAAGAIDELSKENPSAEAVEYKTKDFVKTLEVCYVELLSQQHSVAI